MKTTTPGLFLLLLASFAAGQAPLLPPGDPAPILRLETAGPAAQVTGLAFSPDGKTLYASGFDKAIRVWSADEKGAFRAGRIGYRVPLGPGLNGALNALAVSSDGKRLAAAGQGFARGLAGFRNRGLVAPAAGGFTTEMRLDQGLIFVFSTQDQSVRILRGHPGPVYALAFAPPRKGSEYILVSAAREWNAGRSPFNGGIRLWDAAAGKELAHQGGLPDLTLRPGLAAWRTGDQPRGVRASLAWGDGLLRTWDASEITEKKHLAFNVASAALPGSDRFLTAAYGGDRAKLQLWDSDLSAAREKLDTGANVYPLALALLASRAEGPHDHAAAVVRLPKRDNEYRLHVYSIAADTFGELVFDAPLWTGGTLQPAAASSFAGDRLAVAGHPLHQVLVYSTRDLLNQKAEPQILRSEGETFLAAAFARKGEDRGLILKRTGKRGPGDAPTPLASGDWAFSSARRLVETAPEDWKLDTPDPDGWSVRLQETEPRAVLLVSRNAREVRRLTLPEGHVVQDWAILPPSPLLAVASFNFRLGEPRLLLFNARTGEQVRQYTGHTGMIRSVAFSGDGKLLVSCAQDQTVSAWALTDLDRIVGRIGFIPGLAVRIGGGKLLAAGVEDGSPAKGLIHSSEEIEGVVEAGKLRKLDSPTAFHEAIWLRKPGAAVTLRVKGEGEARDVELKAGQGIDDRKPLFTLFVTRARAKGGPDWLGWNPLGPYESSGQDAEGLLAWHVNTGKPESPTQTVGADQYRKQFQRQGLLRDLLASAAPPRTGALPLPPPRIKLVLEEDGKLSLPDGQGQFFIRQPRAVLRISVLDRAPETLASLSYRIGDGEETRLDLKKADGQDFEVKLDVPRGLNLLRVKATAEEPEPAEAGEELAVRYQPLPPQLKLQSPEGGRRAVVQEADFTFKASAASSIPGEPVLVSLVHRYQGKELLRTPSAPAEEVTRKLKLEPGDNTIELIAVNGKGLDGYKGFETARVSAVVSYRKKDASPIITLKRIVPLNRPAAAVLEAGTGPLAVDAPEVRLEGEIAAEAELTLAELFQPDAKGRPLDGADKKPRKLAFAEKITLTPGEQIVRIAARTETSDPGEAAVTLVYRPRLPTIIAVKPDGELRLIAGKSPAEVQVEGTLLPADNNHPFSAAVLLDGVESKVKVEIGPRTVSARVALGFGVNRLQLRLSNRWNTAVDYGDTKVFYLRPPRIVSWDAPRTAEKPVIGLVAKIDSELPLLPGSIRADISGRELETAPPEKMGERTWLIKLTNVKLAKGTNPVRLSAANREERSEPSVWRVEYTPPAPPIVRITDPGQDGAAPKAEVEVRFAVTSDRPLQEVVVVRAGKPEWRHKVDLADLKAEGGVFIGGPVKVPLLEGVNQIRVESVNEGGADFQTRSVTWVPPPVTLEVLELIPDRTGTSALVPQLEKGKLVLPEALPTGRAKLVGRVTWSSSADERLQKAAIVRVSVNGFQQLPAELKPPTANSPRVRAFETYILLGRKEDNLIELTLPGLPREKNKPVELLAACSKPAQARRLHLLLVSAQDGDEDELKKQFLGAIQAKLEKSGDARTPVFDQVIVYTPRVGYFSRPAFVDQALVTIRNRIKSFAKAGSNSTDIVLFYFKGGEAVNEQGHFFQKPGASPEPGSLTVSALAARFAETPGAHVLLFDVDRLSDGKAARAQENRDEVARWENFHGGEKDHVAVLRYAWLGQAPRDTGFLKGLETVMPKASILIDVTEGMAAFAAALIQKEKPGLSYDRHVSPPLRTAAFGGKPNP